MLVGLAAGVGVSPVEVARSEKDVQCGRLRTRRPHLLAIVVATLCHVSRASAAEGETILTSPLNSPVFIS